MMRALSSCDVGVAAKRPSRSPLLTGGRFLFAATDVLAAITPRRIMVSSMCVGALPHRREVALQPFKDRHRNRAIQLDNVRTKCKRPFKALDRNSFAHSDLLSMVGIASHSWLSPLQNLVVP
jgi:hypothetical protein